MAWAGRTRLDDQRESDRAEERHWRDVCREVDQRDGYRCRACGCRLVQTLARVDNRLEHHHVIPLSLGGEDSVENVASLCLRCHEDRHVKRTLHIKGNANRPLQFEQNGRKWAA